MLDSADLFPNLNSVKPEFGPYAPNNYCYPTNNFHLCPWVANDILISFFLFLLSCLPGFELEMSSVSKAVSLGEWTHGQRGRAGGTKLCTEELAVCSEEEVAGCAVWGAHQNLLEQGEMGPFGTGMKSVLRSASGVCSSWNHRWCREQWELKSFNVMVGVATFPGSQNPFPALF